MTHFLIDVGRETLWLVAYSCAVATPFIAYPRTRRVIFVTARFVMRHAPWWAAPMLTACQFIIGPFDEIVALAILIVPIMRVRRNRVTYGRLVRAAWRGSL